MSSVTLDYLKQTLNIFFESNQGGTKTVKTSKRGPDSQINRAIYELENHLYELKSKYSLNLSLNADISSDNIRDSFNQNTDFQAHRSADFEYNFLLYLVYEYKPEHELRHYIRDFVDVYKKRFTWIDLVITETRATRAITNIRFAVNALREQELLHAKGGKDDNDGLHPTLFGLLVLLYVKHHLYSSTEIDYPFILKEDWRPAKTNYYLRQAIRQLHKPAVSQEFFQYLTMQYGPGMQILHPLIKELEFQIEASRDSVDMVTLVRNLEENTPYKDRLQMFQSFTDALKSK